MALVYFWLPFRMKVDFDYMVIKTFHFSSNILYRNKGCRWEFLYIRNTHPRLKLTLKAENCTAGMHVNTHSWPLRTQKLTIVHGFLPRSTLTSEGGELVNPQKTKIHNETQEICVISLRRSRWRMILNARKS